MAAEPSPCCPEGFPAGWHETEIHWQDKLFVKGRVRGFLHVPLNFGGVVRRLIGLAEQAHAMPDEMLVVSDENSLWGADLYVAVTGDVPGATMSRLSGDYLAKVFEGPYSRIPTWIGEMKRYVASRGRTAKRFYFLYKTCPKCAKKYGKNYVVLLAEA